ncbi:MAG: hypothetical protein CO036_05955 [Candidatus Omnitrophica bacterium CG_4_9_14_0_2_um_filter_43_12]|nr:MAG: hypothetical protein COU52_01900 [Candidatus Omnitrophica bacterium CG10_big_fil_rev_8_21_14_0_10_43_8]PJC45823.1 MAG: hypothetical protein CO036_05955 [Candidatus Omnitrophica bacterium CG_4_9_14_0_2_um_filter_43_12]
MTDDATAQSSGQGRQLLDEERQRLAAVLGAKTLEAVSLGFRIRGQKGYHEEAIVAQIPLSLEGADVSVCGVKGFMIDEVREFSGPDGSKEAVDCAAVAALDIIDSPVHVHAETREVYHILDGAGKMLLGDKIVDVRPGNVILIPPSVEHGLVSDSGMPVKVLLIFTPGIAPKEKPEFRDEAIVHIRTSKRIEELAAVLDYEPNLAEKRILVVSKDGSVPPDIMRFLTESDFTENAGRFVGTNISGVSLADYNKGQDNSYDLVIHINEDGTYSLTSIHLKQPLPVAISIDELKQRIQAWISV